MTVSVALGHATRYRYERPVAFGPHEIRLKPVPACRTPVLSYSLAVRPARHTLHWSTDAAGNHVARAVFAERSARLDIEVDLAVELAQANPFDFLVEPAAERYPVGYGAAALPDLAPFLAAAENGVRLRDWLAALRASVKPDGRNTVELLVDLNARTQREIGYVTRLEHGVQACEETLALRSGSCRDSGWLLVQVLRHLGIAARFVSGYLVQLSGGAPDAPAADSVDLHAWAEAYLPGAGWIGFDPTSGMLTAECHVPLARAATPALAAPLTGSVEPARSEMEVSMTVRRL